MGEYAEFINRYFPASSKIENDEVLYQLICESNLISKIMLKYLKILIIYKSGRRSYRLSMLLAFLKQQIKRKKPYRKRLKKQKKTIKNPPSYRRGIQITLLQNRRHRFQCSLHFPDGISDISRNHPF